MSFDWAAVDQRERNKLDRDRQLKEFLRVQQEEAKDRYAYATQGSSSTDAFDLFITSRKIREKRDGLDDVKRLYGGVGSVGVASAADEAPRAVS